VRPLERVKVDGRRNLGEDGLVGTVGNVADGAETDPTGNGVEETDTLHKEKIDA
jgi:hypothetical protein